MLEVRDARLLELVDTDHDPRNETELESLHGGFGFTEGPVWHPEQNFLVFSDVQGSRQYRWCAERGLEVFRCPSNQANGNAYDRGGAMVSCEHATSQLIRHAHGGKLIEVLATTYQGRRLNSPNDVVVDSHGRTWFTDPTYGRIRDDLGIVRECELDFQGVYRLDPGTAELVCVVDDFEQPNGLCFSLDEHRLFINDTARNHIRVFDVQADGTLSGDTLWAELTGKREGVADGMKLDAGGNVYCNGPGGVQVFDSAGECLGAILTPEKSTNFCFGGPRLDRLFITASTSVYQCPMRVRGLPAF